jgi:hypothetical protein
VRLVLTPWGYTPWHFELVRRALVARGWRVLPAAEAETWAGRGLPLFRYWPRRSIAMVPPNFCKVPR